MKRKTVSVKKLTMLAMLCAIAYALVFLVRIPVVLFLKYEPKDVVIVIGGFLFGPAAAAIVSVLVSLLEMVTISSTGIWGALMNILSTCAFACTAALVYRKKHTQVGAVAGLLIGSVLMCALMLLWNYLIAPFYMGQPREAVAALLLPAFLPFNLLKAGLNTGITLLLYKPVVTALRRVGLLSASAPAASAQPKRISKIGVWCFAALLLATCVVCILIMNGKL